ncbi:DUF2388 domain-containing protein [Pseudomonas sp. MWU13-2105]|uniref:DUF2388 domain-containing protein n=1 Tax=Pseudomonas sp. MWU13-2105 TaxID=2935074 RepID=UPI00200E437C|nr:DUF2388 domain-containing protein [Pseudomonas sp. MWU13-2105]
MRRIFLIPLLTLCLPFGSAMAHRPDIDAGDVATSAGISVSLYSTLRDHKITTPVRDDASSFIASGGAIRGAYLESELDQIRYDHPGLKASDDELANAILIQYEIPAGQQDVGASQ